MAPSQSSRLSGQPVVLPSRLLWVEGVRQRKRAEHECRLPPAVVNGLVQSHGKTAGHVRRDTLGRWLVAGSMKDRDGAWPRIRLGSYLAITTFLSSKRPAEPTPGMYGARAIN